jgi:NADH-quinone oxidoreductase subunit M
MVNHGIVIAALFLIAGFIEMRTGTRQLADFGGMAARLPWLATAFLIAALAALGLPGLNSFAGEFLAFLGAFQVSYVFGALGTLVVIPAAWYMLRFFQGVMEGPARAQSENTGSVEPASTERHAARKAFGDLSRLESSLLAPLLALIIVLGILPGIMTSRMQSSVRQIVIPISTSATSYRSGAHSGADLWSEFTSTH